MKQKIKNHAMNYKMPAKDNLSGKDTTTLELCELGIRTATTRSFPLGKVGEIITFENRPQQYQITEVEKLTKENVSNEAFIKRWAAKEQWQPAQFKKILGGRTVHIGSYQTTFQKV